MITSYPFGLLPDGRAITRYRLSSGVGAWVDILDYGGTIQSLVVPDRDGAPVDVVLGYDDLAGYLAGQCCLGATIGRHAGRIGGGVFSLDGTVWHLAQNDGPNHLHGGPLGFDRQRFTGEICGDELRLHLTSPHLDQGYPGQVQLTVTFSFSEDRALRIHYVAVSDRATLVNLTNHSYFDLSGGRDPLGQRLTLDADRFCESDDHILPTGRLLAVEGTPFDFRQEKPLGRDLSLPDPQLQRCGGYDHCFALNHASGIHPFARLFSPETGIAMTAATDLPGVQLYSANFLQGAGKGGRVYGPGGGICLETQFFPNAINIPGWQAPILRPGEVYDHTTVFQFS